MRKDLNQHVRGGGGQRQKNNTNHVIKYFPRETTRIGRGSGGGEGGGGGGEAKKKLNGEFEKVSNN